MKTIVFICAENYTSYIDPIINLLDEKIIIIEPSTIDKEYEIILKADLVITIHSFLKPVLNLLLKLKDKVRTLTIQDGIIEYKSSAHRFHGIYRYRPVCSDKIAVFGKYSKNLIASSGTNENDIYITGSPRFDELKHIQKEVKSDAPILVTMANRPGYGSSNVLKYYDLMTDLLTWLENNKIEFILRLSRGVSLNGQESLAKAIQNPPEILNKYFNTYEDKTPLYDLLPNVRAVITTPSTVSLEAMLLDLPVAHLLPDPTTVYLKTAWTINKKSDIDDTIRSLLNPEKMKLEFQNMIMKENISYYGNSSKSVVEVINELLSE